MKVKVFPINTGGAISAIPESVEKQINKLLEDHPQLTCGEVEITTMKTGSSIELLLVLYEDKKSKKEVK